MAIIQLDHITKAYGNQVIFNDFSLSINKHEIVVIMGKSGQGKTTLLNIMGLIEPVDKGNVLYDNHVVQKKDIRKFHKEKIGFLFQNFALLEDKSVLYNLEIVYPTLKERKKNRNKILDTLKMVGLENFEHKLVCECSGGQKQRIAIARVILHDSDIILADEPTGSLDKDNRNMVMSLLTRLKEQGKTIVIVTHDDKLKDIADTIIEI